LHVEVAAVGYGALSSGTGGESSAAIRRRVSAAREAQRIRFGGRCCNAKIPPSAMREACRMTDGAKSTLRRAFDSLNLSARAYDKVLKVARTAADLAGSDTIDAPHIAEAVQYRALDKKYWRR
jgi:magnesium chelatase family protein